jgi:hypothetical protein
MLLLLLRTDDEMPAASRQPIARHLRGARPKLEADPEKLTTSSDPIGRIMQWGQFARLKSI